MASLENDGSNKQTTGNDAQEEASIYEDEINLIDYFLVLWKRKWFIFLASVLPALVVGLAIFLWPRDYKISYTYNVGLGEKAFKVLEDTFYSEENIEKLVEKLQTSDFNKYAKKIAEPKTEKKLKEFIFFEISPLYSEVMKPLEAKNIEELQKLNQVKGTLLVMTIMGNPQKDMYTISSIMRNNFEKVIPIYSVKNRLVNNIEALKTNMAKIERGRFSLGLELERKKATLTKLKNLKSGDSIINLNNKKFTNSKEQKDILKNENKIKVEFFNQKKGNFILDIERKESYLADAYFQFEDISINSIDQKFGVYNVRFVYNFSKLYAEAYKEFNDIADGTIIYDDNGISNIEVCVFTEEEFARTKMNDPGFQIKVLNVAKKDKDLSSIHYKLTPYAIKYGNDFDALYLQKNIEGIFGIKNKFNLRAFPFDRQKLSLELIDGRYNLDKRNIFISERTHIFLNKYIKKNEILGWDIMEYELNPFQYQNPFNMKNDFSDGLRLDLFIERKHGYYVFKVIIPIVLILLICWGSVWIDPKEIESRLTITIVCLLSLIAYNFVIDSEMPKLEYLTVMDWIILISYFYATIPNFLSIASFRFQKTNLVACERIETYSRRYGILSYILIIFFIVAINANLNSENSSALISWMVAN